MKRHLCAILAADIVGYSRLVEADETGVLTRQKKHLSQFLLPVIERHRGRIVKLMGDGILVEFSSAVEAVSCAVEVQREMPEREAGYPEGSRIEYRIGINLGDVVAEGEDILGTGVNIAARLEQAADPGGICVSGTVYDQLGALPSLRLEPLGEIEVKNIEKPVRAYRIALSPDGMTAPPRIRRKKILPAALAMVAASIVGGWFFFSTSPRFAQSTGSEQVTDDRPSIAVLPFDNFGAAGEEDYFSDGMTEDLITDLSKVSGLFVLARNTTFAYRDQAMDLQEVARELGVQYVVEGSVRRVGDRIRINAQLIDARTGGHIWADRYDRDMTDVLELQDDVVKRIVTELAVTLDPDEAARLAEPKQVDPEAYDLLLRGLEQFRRFSPDTNRVARSYFERALAIDPNFARAEADLALTYAMDAEQVWTQYPHEASRKAQLHAERALKLDAKLAQVHFAFSLVHRNLGDIDASIAASQRAVELDPNYADGYATLASSLAYAGRVDESFAAIEHAVKLNPIRAFFYVWIEGLAHYVAGDHARAAELFERVLIANPEFTAAHRMLAATYIELDQIDDAEWSAHEVLATAPGFRVSLDAKVTNFMDAELKERYLAALQQAGLP
ncbi:adenylate/guanylate cyclase domain-containing protein [Lutimaribacter marinistellae]|uniref:Adenylate/guanylate cyclase domain-containing protein n=1 Tax=Lutimaribacter marinistellae TaxID=1820329 RepID=A0ABV7TLZ4_9RHOB